MKSFLVYILFIAVPFLAFSAKKQALEPSYAWTATPPLGLHSPATIDTLLYNYYKLSIPSLVSDAYATTGNLGGTGLNSIYFERKDRSEFFFADVLQPWLYDAEDQVYYNTRIPMTLLSYNWGGGRDSRLVPCSIIFIRKEATTDRLLRISPGVCRGRIWVTDMRHKSHSTVSILSIWKAVVLLMICI